MQMLAVAQVEPCVHQQGQRQGCRRGAVWYEVCARERLSRMGVWVLASLSFPLLR